MTFICSKGDEHHYTVADDAKFTCDVNAGNLTDLQKGSTIRMTMCKDDKCNISAIDCGKQTRELATD